MGDGTIRPLAWVNILFGSVTLYSSSDLLVTPPGSCTQKYINEYWRSIRLT